MEARTRIGGLTARSCFTSSQAGSYSLYRSKPAVRSRVSEWQALFDTRLSRVDRWIGGLFPGAPSYDVAPDGKRFLVRAVREQSADPPLVLVTNWQAGFLK